LQQRGVLQQAFVKGEDLGGLGAQLGFGGAAQFAQVGDGLRDRLA